MKILNMIGVNVAKLIDANFASGTTFALGAEFPNSIGGISQGRREILGFDILSGSKRSTYFGLVVVRVVLIRRLRTLTNVMIPSTPETFHFPRRV